LRVGLGRARKSQRVVSDDWVSASGDRGAGVGDWGSSPEASPLCSTTTDPSVARVARSTSGWRGSGLAVVSVGRVCCRDHRAGSGTGGSSSLAKHEVRRDGHREAWEAGQGDLWNTSFAFRGDLVMEGILVREGARTFTRTRPRSELGRLSDVWVPRNVGR